jgi:polyhydroxybutyrate depolymerase
MQRMHRRLLATLAAAALLVTSGALAGCSDDDGGTANAAAECPAPTTGTPAATAVKVQSGGQERTYYVWLPDGYDGTEAVPVVADFHGAGGDALSYTDGFSTMTEDAPERGYLVVAGDAIAQGSDGSGIGWVSSDTLVDGGTIPTPGETGPTTISRDAQFFRDIVDSLAETYCIDRDRLYVTGFSSGGSFSAYAGCALPELAAVAPLAGVNLSRPCDDAPGMPMITMHGDADQAAYFTGFEGLDDPDDPTLNSFHGDVTATVARWAERNGCDPVPLEEPYGDAASQSEAIKKTYQNCDDGDDVVFYVLKGADHLYPGGLRASRKLMDDPKLSKVDGSTLILDFFDAHTNA